MKHLLLLRRCADIAPHCIALVCAVFALIAPANAQKVVQIAGGENHSVFLREDGSVWTFGDNSWGQLGDGTTQGRASPTRVPGLVNVVHVAAGLDHTLALNSDGTVWAWGQNYDGQVGGNESYQPIPRRVSNLSGVVSVFAGNSSSSSYALTADGALWAWGANYSGTLGDGTTISRTVPTKVSIPVTLKSVAPGFDHVLALSVDGAVWAWGSNGRGQAGDGTTTTHLAPVKLLGLDGVKALAAGIQFSLAVKTEGVLYGWGGGVLTPRAQSDRNDFQSVSTQAGNVIALLSDGSVLQLSGAVSRVPVNGAKAIASGRDHHLVLLADSSVWAWGANIYGQLGDGAITFQVTPVVAKFPSQAAAASVATGGAHTVIKTTDNKVWAAGLNNSGQLGDGSSVSRVSFKEVIGAGSDLNVIASGATNSGGLRLDGSIVMWGDNYYGQLGDGTKTNRSSPVVVTSLSNVKNLSLSDGFHTLASRADGSVWAWGGNNNGQLGNNSLVDQSRPIPIPGLTGITDVSAGRFHSLAVSSDGGVFDWGGVAKRSVSRVVGLSAIKSVSAGCQYSLARASDGSVWSWGINRFGQLGIGNTSNSIFAPSRVIGINDAIQVAAACDVSTAVVRSGDVYWWGKDAGSRPVSLPWLRDVTHVAAKFQTLAALTRTGRVLMWGSNSYGQLGIAGPQASAIPKMVFDPQQPSFTKGAYPVVEFENKAIAGGRYFMTVQTDEIKAIDGLGPSGGFDRTGRAWRAWQKAADVPTGLIAKPVYRFYVPGPNSHFYTLDEGERERLVNYNINLNPKVHQFEGLKFYALAPLVAANGAKSCGAGTYPVYRAFNNKVATNQGNHRITSNYIDIFRGVRFFGWTDEGVVFCSPVSSINGGDLQAYHTFPGDIVNAGSKMTAECVYNNAGPGNAPGATIHCALPYQVNWTLSCVAKSGATCPALGDPAINAEGTLTQNNLREGINLTSFPAGGILTIKATATAPSSSMELIYASAIATPGGAPDPVATNNISAGLSKSIVKSSSDCIVTVSTDSLATSATDTRTQQVSIKAPNGCAWSIQTASDTPGMLTPTLSSGVGDATLNVATSANGSSADRSAQITVTVTTPSAASSSTYDTSKASPFEDTRRVARTYIRQSAPKGADTGCTSLSLNRNSERQGANIINGGVSALASTTSCTWTSTVDQSWVAITQGASGTGTGSINYQLQANPTNAERTATISIKGSATTAPTTLTIIQAANTTNLVNNGGAEGGSGDGGGDGGAGASGGGGEGPGGE